MKFKAVRSSLDKIRPFRLLFLQEANIQFIHHSFHERGWAIPYLLTADEVDIGYGALCKRESWDTVFEFYVLPPFRSMADLAFVELIAASGATFMACQSNDFLLSCMLYEFAENIHTSVILFEDHAVTQLAAPGVHFRGRTAQDHLFEHKGEPEGDYVLEYQGEIVASGGFLLHYNMPFADLYMEVREDQRKKGLGSFLIQELKRECYLAGRVPAARCGMQNRASRATLVKAGLRICGFELNGDIRK